MRAIFHALLGGNLKKNESEENRKKRQTLIKANWPSLCYKNLFKYILF